MYFETPILLFRLFRIDMSSKLTDSLVCVESPSLLLQSTVKLSHYGFINFWLV